MTDNESMTDKEFDWGCKLIDEDLVKGASDPDFTPVVARAGGEEACYLEFKATPWHDSAAAKAHGGETCNGRDDYLWNVVKAIIALANTSGGAILLGIDPKIKKQYDRSPVPLPVVIKELDEEGWESDWDRKSNALVAGLSLDEYTVQDGDKVGKIKLDGARLRGQFRVRHVSYRAKRTAVIMVHQAERKIIAKVDGADTMYVRDLGDVGRTKKITDIGEALDYHSPSRESGRRPIYREPIARQPEMLNFVGHGRELDQLKQWLMPDGNRRSPEGALSPICVCGDDGVGRSLLLAKAEGEINGMDGEKFEAVFRYDASRSKDLDINDVLSGIARNCQWLCPPDCEEGATLSRKVLEQIKRLWLRTLIVIINVPSPELFHDRELREEVLSDKRITIAATARASFYSDVEPDNPNRWLVLKINEWSVKNAKDLLLARSGKKADGADEKAALDQIVQIFRAIPAELCQICERIGSSTSETPYRDVLEASVASGTGATGSQAVWQGKIAELRGKSTWQDALPILSALAVLQEGAGRPWVRELFVEHESGNRISGARFERAMEDISEVSSVVLPGVDADISDVVVLHPFFRHELFEHGDQDSHAADSLNEVRALVFAKVAETFAKGDGPGRRWAGRVLTGMICRAFERQVAGDGKAEAFQLATPDRCWRDERDSESRYCVKIMDWMSCNPLGRLYVSSLPSLGVGLSAIRDLLKKASYISGQMEKACVAKTVDFAHRRMCSLYLGLKLAELDRNGAEERALTAYDEWIAAIERLRNETVGLTPAERMQMEMLEAEVRLSAASDASDYGKVRESFRKAVRSFQRIPHWRVMFEMDRRALANQLMRFRGKRTESQLDDVRFIFACLDRAEREMEFGHAWTAGAFCKRARKTAAKRNWETLAAVCLNREAYSYLYRGKYAKAIKKYNKVIGLYSKTKGDEADCYAGVGFGPDGRIVSHTLEARYFIAVASWLRDVSDRGSADPMWTKSCICGLCGPGGLDDCPDGRGDLARSAEQRGLVGTGDKFFAWRDNLRLRAGLVRLLGTYHAAGAVSRQNACYHESMRLNWTVLQRQEELFGAGSPEMEAADINDDIGNCCALVEDYQRAEEFVDRAYAMRSNGANTSGRPDRSQRRKLRNSYERLFRIHAATAVASFESAKADIDRSRRSGDCLANERSRTEAAFSRIKKVLGRLDDDLRINRNWAIGLLSVEQREENERVRQMFGRLQQEELRPLLYEISKGEAGNASTMPLIMDGNDATGVPEGA